MTTEGRLMSFPDDYSMCQTTHCQQSKRCRRHPDSGTIPSIRQSWTMFDPVRCHAYWAVEKKKDLETALADYLDEDFSNGK